MIKNPTGPTPDQGKLLEYIKNQTTPADEGDSKFNKTPRQYAAQHRLVLWLMYVHGEGGGHRCMNNTVHSKYTHAHNVLCCWQELAILSCA